MHRPFLLMLGIYYDLTLAYSLRLKKIVILDVIVLAALFTVRMMAGSAAVAIWPPPGCWPIPCFCSSAWHWSNDMPNWYHAHDHGPARARSYVVSDSELLAAMGVASAFMAVLVLVLYITSGPAQSYYGRHQVIWLAARFALLALLHLACCPSRRHA